jgi:hypothetical protein
MLKKLIMIMTRPLIETSGKTRRLGFSSMTLKLFNANSHPRHILSKLPIQPPWLIRSQNIIYSDYIQFKILTLKKSQFLPDKWRAVPDWGLSPSLLSEFF